jgi:SAM-dependent methyltransferase
MGLIDATAAKVRQDINNISERGSVSVVKNTPQLVTTVVGSVGDSVKATVESDAPLTGWEDVEEHYFNASASDLESYTDPSPVSPLLERSIESFEGEEPELLEIGCNAGRHVSYLSGEGFSKISAIELNPEAIKLFKETWPEVVQQSDILIGRAQDVTPCIDTNSYDIVYTVAVLQHIPEPESLFEEMARIASERIIICEIEGELDEPYRAIPSAIFHDYRTIFPREYEDIFGDLGWSCETVLTAEDVEAIDGGLPDERYTFRVFTNEEA